MESKSTELYNQHEKSYLKHGLITPSGSSGITHKFKHEHRQYCQYQHLFIEPASGSNLNMPKKTVLITYISGFHQHKGCEA